MSTIDLIYIIFLIDKLNGGTEACHKLNGEVTNTGHFVLRLQ